MILSIETSTDVCSVALHHRATLVATKVAQKAYSHAEKLAPMIDELLKETGVTRSDLKAVAVSAGPGSYTGLRIGVSTAKGLCFGLDIPLITVNTLESMLVGLPAQYNDALRCPMIDARRMEVYCLLASADGTVIETTQARIIDEKSFQPYLEQHTVLFYGNGAAKSVAVIKHPNAQLLDGITPLAKNIGVLAQEKYENRDFADTAYFEPDYLKPFHAIKPKNLLQ